MFIVFLKVPNDEAYDALDRGKWAKYNNRKSNSPFYRCENPSKEYEKVIQSVGFVDVHLHVESVTPQLPEKSFDGKYIVRFSKSFSNFFTTLVVFCYPYISLLQSFSLSSVLFISSPLFLSLCLSPISISIYFASTFYLFLFVCPSPSSPLFSPFPSSSYRLFPPILPSLLLFSLPIPSLPLTFHSCLFLRNLLRYSLFSSPFLTLSHIFRSSDFL